jgi:O-antigen/teichoic acid export membrane protein
MHANIGSLPDDAAPFKKARERLISIPYMLLRASTAGGAVATGFVQTFVFARVLAPERFSIFIVVGAIGYTLWLADLGLANILFLNLRGPYLAGGKNEKAAHQATAVIVFYAALAIAASCLCFAAALAQPSSTLRDAFELALFLLYIALNLAWTSLRSVSIAVDQFLFYERLELVRRIVNISTMLAMLGGLSLTLFLIASNVLWALLFAAAWAKLVARGALDRRLRGLLPALQSFFTQNRHAIARSATGALSGAFSVTFPYYVVPLWFGLGEAPIILEVTFRIFRGACVIFAAICDLAIPGQTRAVAARDAVRLVKTTLLVAGLCCVPAAIACALLVFAGGPLFVFLLRSAATIPHAIVPILVALLLISVLQIVSEALLQYTGFFRSLAYNGAAVATGMVLVTAFAVVAKLDLVGFLAAYTLVYASGAICLAIAAVCGPVRAASVGHGETPPSDGSSSARRRAAHTPSAVPIRQGAARSIPQPNRNP